MQPIVDQALPVLRKYGVKKAALFGSYARGTFDQKSDVDILIEPPENMGLSFIRLKLDLEEKLDKKVDLVSYNGMSKYLKKYILADQVSIL